MAEPQKRDIPEFHLDVPLGAAAGPPSMKPAPLYAGLPSGTGLGKYRILERVGATHNAVLYKARDLMLDRLVTIKQMSPELIDNPVACGCFKREAQLLARIPRGNPHVVGIHELIEDDLGLFIVEEYIPGHWLEVLISKRRLDLNDTLRILKTTALGLRTLHSLGIAHRGIHPGTIFVTAGAKAKITNLSTAASETDDTPPPIIVSKYAAPELLLGLPFDDRVDIYSLGMVLFEMCIGRPALNRHFSGTLANGGWLQWHIDPRAALPSVTEFNPHVPPHIAALVRRMTAKNLDERIPSIHDVLKALSPSARPPVILPAGDQPTGWNGSPFGRPAFGPANGPAYPQPITTRTVAQAGTLPPRTSRTVLQTAALPASSASEARPSPTAGQHPMAPPTRREAVIGTAATRRHGRLRHLAPPPPVHRVSRINQIPTPEPTIETLKERRPRWVVWTVAAVLALAVVGGGVGGSWWYFAHGPGSLHRINLMYAEAEKAYDAQNWDAAQRQCREILALDSSRDPRLTAVQSRAETILLLLQAERALARDEFDLTQQKLDEAARRGGSSARLDSLQTRLWNKRDAYRLAAEGVDEILRGQFERAELKLDEYEQKAKASGVDPDALRDRLDLSRKDRKYAEAIREANAALKNGDFDKALLSCRDAENLSITSETRELRKRILNLKQRAEQVLLGDDAMLARDFEAAAAAYERANQIEASDEIEAKARCATAYVLYNEALEAIAKGDLLAAEQTLRNSLWKFPLNETRLKLARMAPAFEAARLVRKADLAAKRGDREEAERLYLQALPNLPDPARGQTRDKLDQLRQEPEQQAGDRTAKRGPQ